MILPRHRRFSGLAPAVPLTGQIMPYMPPTSIAALPLYAMDVHARATAANIAVAQQNALANLAAAQQIAAIDMVRSQEEALATAALVRQSAVLTSLPPSTYPPIVYESQLATAVPNIGPIPFVPMMNPYEPRTVYYA